MGKAQWGGAGQKLGGGDGGGGTWRTPCKPFEYDTLTFKNCVISEFTVEKYLGSL